MARLHLLLFACLLSAASALPAQTYTAQRVTFSDPGPFTQAQLEEAAGVHAGTSLTAAQLGAAAQRLVDSGYFEDVGATLEGKITAVTVKFTDKPIATSQMIHVAFENFVWLSHAEVESAIHAKLPLFIDYLPENSPQQDAIKAALTGALASKSIKANVVSDTAEPTLRHPTRELEFRIDQPDIRVSNIKLSGVSPSLAPYVQKSVNETARTLYVEGPADLTTADRVLAPLLDAGYAQAALTSVSLAPNPAADGNVGVVLTARLTAGEVYKVSSLTFAGTPLLSAAAFQSSARLHPGDIASQAALLQTLMPLDDAYRSKGYMDVVIESGAVPDTASQQVAYTITVVPGAQYRVHEVTTVNLDPAAKADFERGFLMKTGELYNPSYLTGFLKNNTALQALNGYSSAFKAYADPATHTVDLVITFVRASRR